MQIRVVSVNEAQKRKVKEGIEMCVLAWGGALMMTQVFFKKGTSSESHSHKHEQLSYVVEGDFIYAVDDKRYEVKKGHSIYIPPNVPHWVEAITDGILVDVFTPTREDFLKKGD